MLESIREGVKKPWVKIVVFAIVISFVFAGYFSSAFFSGDPNAVAIVNGESVDRNTFQQVYANVKSSRADFYKATVKTEEDERNFQENVLQQVIEDKVIEQSASELGLRLSQQKLREIIQTDPNYQIDGTYSSAMVEQTMARVGMSREAFKRYYENQATRNQLISGLFQTEFSLAAETEKSYAYLSQKRSGKALKVNIENFKQNTTITDEEVAQYYADNQQQFRLEEKVSVDYLELSVEKLQASQEPTNEQIETYYQDNLSRFQEEEQRQYSHILVLSKDDDAAALAKATSISLRINQGEDFSSIAQAESDDVPTRDVGGDLGVLLVGSLEEASEEAVKLLTDIGQTSEPVKLDYGYQILKLTNIIEGQLQPLSKVKDELLPELKKQLAEEEFYRVSELLKEKSFEFSDSLKEAAESTGLEVQTSPLFSRSTKLGVFANAQVQEAAFSDDVIEAKLNSETIQISDKHILVLRSNKHQPSEIEPLANVKTKVVNNLTQSNAKKTAQALSIKLLNQLETNQNVDELLSKNKLSWIDLDKVERNNAQLSYTANSQFFKMSPPVDNVVYDIAEDYQGYTVLMLNSVEKGDWSQADEATKTQRKLFLSSYFSNADYESFKKNLRSQASVTRNLNNLAR